MAFEHKLKIHFVLNSYFGSVKTPVTVESVEQPFLNSLLLYGANKYVCTDTVH